jgi:hypothetical protein
MVSVVAYKPVLQPDGFWTCDVAIDSGPAYSPFVQLGLVRYQPHAVDGLHLSPPIRRWVKVPPAREGRVVFKSDDHTLTFERHGIGYYRTETGDRHDDERHLTDFPLLNWRLLTAVRRNDVPWEGSPWNGEISWRPVLQNGQVVQKLRLRPIQRGAELWWVGEVTLPERRYDGDYALLLEEIELMAQEVGAGTKARDNDCEMVFTSRLQERGPLFSHIVDLRA